MDPVAATIANALVGNPPSSATLEWGLGGGTLRFESDVVIALSGASAEARIGTRASESYMSIVVHRGEELEVGRIGPGRFLYVAVAGGIDVPLVMGSRSTYLPGRFGGLEGRLLRSGDRLTIARPNSRPAGRAPSAPALKGDLTLPTALAPDYSRAMIRITRGTHARLFRDAALATLLENEYTVSPASDRTGYRLDGAPITDGPSTLPSEAGCPGVIQIPGDGKPIVLMADAPTVGGYPKLGVVSEIDLPVLAQRSPGERVRFNLISVEESQRLLRERLEALHEIARLSAQGYS